MSDFWGGELKERIYQLPLALAGGMFSKRQAALAELK